MPRRPGEAQGVHRESVFAHEASMANWADEVHGWYEGDAAIHGARLWWHRAIFPGDVTVRAGIPLPPTDRSLGVLALSLCKRDRPADAAADGYVLNCHLSPTVTLPAGQPEPRVDGATVNLKLVRRGTSVAEETFDVGAFPRQVSLRRAGDHLIAAVDTRARLVWRDAQPLDSARVAYAVTDNLPVCHRHVRIDSEQVHNYTFNRAPTEWRAAAGWWEINARWDCDPQWRFFSGRTWPQRYRPQDHLKPAIIWNRRLFPGDVVVEAFVGPMQVAALRRSYEYMRDLNIVLAGDGVSPAGGYTCSLGAADNTCSAIFRAGERVAEDPQGRLDRSKRVHAQWYYLRAARAGRTVRFAAWLCPHHPNPWRKVTELEFEDPQPLTGRQVGLWTYGTGMVIGRVRISGHGGKELENIDAPPHGPVRTYLKVTASDEDQG
jgi:hypothetical protein